MVTFNEEINTSNNEYKPQSFTVSIVGDKEDYIRTLSTLLRIMPILDEKFSETERYYISNLVDSMLPTFTQVVNIDDIQKLESIKEKNKAVVDTFVKEE